MMRTQTQLHRVEGVRGTDYSPATPSHASPDSQSFPHSQGCQRLEGDHREAGQEKENGGASGGPRCHAYSHTDRFPLPSRLRANYEGNEYKPLLLLPGLEQ